MSTYRTAYKNTYLSKANAVGQIKPLKFGGLSYKILKDCGNNVVQIQTTSFGKVYISSKSIYLGSISTNPKYKNGNY